MNVVGAFVLPVFEGRDMRNPRAVWLQSGLVPHYVVLAVFLGPYGELHGLHAAGGRYRREHCVESASRGIDGLNRHCAGGFWHIKNRSPHKCEIIVDDCIAIRYISPSRTVRSNIYAAAP